MTLDDTGSTSETSVRDAWGVQTAGSTAERFGAIAQRETDFESGLVFMRNRMYDPSLGRFTQLDPLLGNRPEKHYAYASNNPLSRVDPFGLDDNPKPSTALSEHRREIEETYGKYSDPSSYLTQTYGTPGGRLTGIWVPQKIVPDNYYKGFETNAFDEYFRIEEFETSEGKVLVVKSWGMVAAQFLISEVLTAAVTGGGSTLSEALGPVINWLAKKFGRGAANLARKAVTAERAVPEPPAPPTIKSTPVKNAAAETSIKATEEAVGKFSSWQARRDWITRRLKEHVTALRKAELTGPQRETILKSGRASTYWGTQIDEEFKFLVQNDPTLAGEVVVSKRWLPKGTVAPDVIDIKTKCWWDLTSDSAAFAPKVPKYDAQFGQGVGLFWRE